MNSTEYFMGIANSVALKSKDESSKVGCVLVCSDNRIISTGYNGMVAGCDESFMSWERPHKYAVVLHAEVNALLHAQTNLKGAKAFISHGPCNDCLKQMLQAGIREIHYGCAGIMRDRGTEVQLWAIEALIKATNAKVINANTNKTYLEELKEGK